MKLQSLLIVLLYTAIADGQDSAAPKFVSIPQVNLFCMLNQNIYNAGDTILVAGYITNRSREIMEDQTVMNQLIIDPILRKIVAANRYAIESGLCRATIKIPDTLDSGDYWYVAFTNYAWSRPPQHEFRQQLQVHGLLGKPFNIISDSTEEKADSIYIHYKIGTRYKGVASGGTIDYHLWQMADSVTSGRVTIDDFGEAMIPVSRKQINMNYNLYEQIQVAMIVTRKEERGRFIVNVCWKPKTGIPAD